MVKRNKSIKAADISKKKNLLVIKMMKKIKLQMIKMTLLLLVNRHKAERRKSKDTNKISINFKRINNKLSQANSEIKVKRKENLEKIK